MNRIDIDYMELLYENRNISIYQLDAIHLGKNKNNMSISKECAEKSLPSFADSPLYCIIDNQYDQLNWQNNDFLEHFREEMPWGATRDRVLPFGTVPESAIPNAKFVDRDGKTYLRMQVVVWKRLLPHVSNILKKRDGTVKVSVEFTIDEFHKIPNDDTVYIDKFTITAITVLGAKMEEVMDGAMIKSVKFSFGDYFRDCNTNYCSFVSESSFDVPENVLNAMSEGISIREKYGRGTTEELYNNICSIINNKKMLKSQADEINNYFCNLEETPQKTRNRTNKYITYKVFGGEDCKTWLNSIYNGTADVINSKKEGGNDIVDIKIDNSKESAVKSEKWENPGKELYEKLFEASNVTELVYEAYLIAHDGFQDTPSESLKYPHHVIKDGKLVVDIAGVEAALARAKQQGIFDDETVYKHLKRHYEELELPMDAFEKKNSECECDEEDEEEEEEDFKNKYVELESKFSEMEKVLNEYKKKEEVEMSVCEIEKYAHCFDEAVKNELIECAKTDGKEACMSKLCSKVMEFALNAKDCMCSNGEEGVQKFSMPNPFYNPDLNKKKESDQSSLSGIIKRQKTRVN